MLLLTKCLSIRVVSFEVSTLDSLNLIIMLRLKSFNLINISNSQASTEVRL